MMMKNGPAPSKTIRRPQHNTFFVLIRKKIVLLSLISRVSCVSTCCPANMNEQRRPPKVGMKKYREYGLLPYAPPVYTYSVGRPLRCARQSNDQSLRHAILWAKCLRRNYVSHHSSAYARGKNEKQGERGGIGKNHSISLAKNRCQRLNESARHFIAPHSFATNSAIPDTENEQTNEANLNRLRF